MRPRRLCSTEPMALSVLTRYVRVGRHLLVAEISWIERDDAYLNIPRRARGGEPGSFFRPTRSWPRPRGVQPPAVPRGEPRHRQDRGQLSIVKALQPASKRPRRDQINDLCHTRR